MLARLRERVSVALSRAPLPAALVSSVALAVLGCGGRTVTDANGAKDAVSGDGYVFGSKDAKPGKDQGSGAEGDAAHGGGETPGDGAGAVDTSPLCRPCTSSDQCVGAGLSGGCATFGDEGAFCGVLCSGDCPLGTECVAATTVEDSEADLCLPKGGALCECTAGAMANGYETACVVKNAHGACPGKRSCSDGGLTACSAPTPAPEVCGGGDEDCDGETDEPLAGGCVPRFLDLDSDGYGAGEPGPCTCAPDGDYTAEKGGDCDDFDSAVPHCAGKECGPDGCGGTCGECVPGSSCLAAGVCSSCKPDCLGKQCGSDGCGGQCGKCEPGLTCDLDGHCVCIPSCAGLECGGDGCGGTCGACAPSEKCSDAGKCVCSPSCAGKLCGPDGCGGSCGKCSDKEQCVEGTCKCAPKCAGLDCGSDGCGGSCGKCAPGEECKNGICKACVPSCTGPSGKKECGPDGCGGACGECAVGKLCDAAGHCLGGGQGDTCASPFVAGALPFTYSGDTSDSTSDYQFAAGQCPPETSGGGGSAKDEVFLFVAPSAGEYAISLTGTFDTALYVVSDCSAAGTSCLAGAEDPCTGCVEKVQVKLAGGQKVYVVVDGFFGAMAGAYTLTIQAAGCKPQCAGIACGPDGCGGTCGTCAVGQTCSSGKCVCAPACTGPSGPKECGPDGCGGSCGTCAKGMECTVAGLCQTPPQSTCKGYCGSFAPGGCQCDAACFELADCCADVCTFCATDYPEECCQPKCAGPAGPLQCGPDGCGGECGTCPAGKQCEDGQCVCVPQCAGKTCGPDGCGGVCGTCLPGQTCGGAGQCEGGDSCDGYCGEKAPAACWCDSACFDLGDCCEDVCDFCAGVFPIQCCEPSCTGKACGGDGCGGSCGSCAGGLTCSAAGTCVGKGDTCADAHIVGALPFTFKGSTSDQSDSYSYDKGQCPPETDGWGKGSKDETLKLTAPESGSYRVTLTAAFDSNLYVVSDCANVNGTCVAGDEDICTGCTEEVTFTLSKGQTVFIVVDAWGGTAAGDYTLKVEQIPGAGDTCDNPFVVGAALPFTFAGDTTGAADNYAYSAGKCPPEEDGWGKGTPDEPFRFVPKADGKYRISLTAAYDSNLYVVTDCANVDGTCVAGDEDICTGCTEEVTVDLKKGTAYFIIVDGWGGSAAGTYALKIELLQKTPSPS